MKYILMAAAIAFAQLTFAATSEARCMGPAWKCPVVRHQQDRVKPKYKRVTKKNTAQEW